MNPNSRSIDSVYIAIEKYKCHASIKTINENVSFESPFNFKKIKESDIQKSNLNSKKAVTIGNIPTEILNSVLQYMKVSDNRKILFT